MRWNAKAIGITAAVIIVVAAIGFVVARSGPALGQSLTIGYVDMARAIEAHPRKASAEADTPRSRPGSMATLWRKGAGEVLEEGVEPSRALRPLGF